MTMTYTATEVQEAFERGIREGEADAAERLHSMRQALRAHERAASREGAPRQAEDEVVSASPDVLDQRLRDAGVAVRTGVFVPGGAAVRLDVGELSRWLQPDEAHELSLALEHAAIAALHEDRALRHAAHAARTGFGQERAR